MKTSVKRLYEALFLVDPSQSGSTQDEATKNIEKILKKAKAEVLSIKKWDERKLAYGISGCDRGTYMLCYFKADGERIKEIERSVQLSESILRVMILNAEAMSSEDIEKDTPIMQAEKQEQTTPEPKDDTQTKPSEDLEPGPEDSKEDDTVSTAETASPEAQIVQEKEG